MDTMHPSVQFFSVLFGFIALMGFLGMVSESRLLSVRMRYSLQWVFICLVCVLIVAAVVRAPQFFVRSEYQFVPYLFTVAGGFALGGDFFTARLEAEGKSGLGGRVCRVLMVVAVVLNILIYAVERLPHHSDLAWLVSEWR